MKRLLLAALTVLALSGLVGCGAGVVDEEYGAGEGEQAVTVAPRGSASTLDVASWNLEWFGASGQGPTNESLQQNNVRDAIRGTDFDVWGLVEVVSAGAFSNLLAGLPGYQGILANDSRVSGGTNQYSTSEQKPALIWKSSVASLVSAKVILATKALEFAGRPPLEVVLDVTVNGATERHVFVVVHMKAGSDADSWKRRSNASAALKAHLDATWAGQKVLVLGDWNDGLLKSISSGKATPWANFISDADYGFATMTLAQSRIGTFCSSTNAIDHQLASRPQLDDLVEGSVQVYRLSELISGYCSNTTDHFPVLASYRVGSGTAVPAKVIVNEILANEPGSDTTGEFVEIVNVGGAAADLSGWTITTAATVRHTFPAGTVLAGGKALAVFGATASSGRLSLGNSGGTVAVLDAAGFTVDTVTYTSGLSSTDSVSMNRAVDGDPEAGFVLHTSLASGLSSPGARVNGAAF